MIKMVILQGQMLLFYIVQFIYYLINSVVLNLSLILSITQVVYLLVI